MTEATKTKRKLPDAVKAENGVWVAHKEGRFGFGPTRNAARADTMLKGVEAFESSSNNLALIMAHQRLTGEEFPWPQSEGEDYQILSVGGNFEQFHIIRRVRNGDFWEIVLPFINGPKDATKVLELLQDNPETKLSKQLNIKVVSNA